MPLMPFKKVYQNFPESFADGVTQHVRRRTESYREDRTASDGVGKYGVAIVVLCQLMLRTCVVLLTVSG